MAIFGGLIGGPIGAAAGAVAGNQTVLFSLCTNVLQCIVVT